MAGESEVEIKGEAAEAEWGSEIEIQIYIQVGGRKRKERQFHGGKGGSVLSDGLFPYTSSYSCNHHSSPISLIKFAIKNTVPN